MSNKKVYLAKHVLASGFDVEYVKSSLSRIPGIDIVESGSGMDPSECACLVVVTSVDGIQDGVVSVSKNVYDDIEEYLEYGEGGSGCVYFVIGRGTSGHPLDVELDYPEAIMINEEWDGINEDYNTYNSMSDLDGDDTTNLLDWVEADIDAPRDAFLKVPRHHQPKPEYAMPPVPTIEERRLKKSASLDLPEQYPFRDIAQTRLNELNGSKRLLLLRRK